MNTSLLKRFNLNDIVFLISNSICLSLVYRITGIYCWYIVVDFIFSL